DQGPVPLTAGYACGLDPDSALLGALLEAAQSRLTDIHGARDDVSAAETQAVEKLRAACESADPRRRAAGMPSLRRTGTRARAIRMIVERLGSAAAFELAPPELGLSIIKVVVPGLVVSELL
ncbi:MAG: YcaO-like family protein, partial [Deltaproteobacteria bacterium]|nr:YcaO-like family protein [Deltaproteobacteria bacterium]